MKKALIFIPLLLLALTVYPQEKSRVIKPKKSVVSASPCSSKSLKDSPKLRGLQLGMNIGEVSKNFSLEPLTKKSDDYLYSEDIRKAESRVFVAEVELNAAIRERNRTAGLFKEGVVSKIDLDQADKRVVEAGKSLNVAKARLNEILGEVSETENASVKWGRVALGDVIFELEFEDNELSKINALYTTKESWSNIDEFLSLFSRQLKLKNSWVANRQPEDGENRVQGLTKKIDKLEDTLYWLQRQDRVNEAEVQETKLEISKLRLERSGYYKPEYYERGLSCAAFNIQGSLPRSNRPQVMLSKSASLRRSKGFKP